MAPRLIWLMKSVAHVLLLVIAGYCLCVLYQQLMNSQSNVAKVAVIQKDYLTAKDRTRLSTKEPVKIIREEASHEKEKFAKPDVTISSTSGVFPTKKSEIDIRKALGDISRRMNLTLEHAENGPGEFGAAVVINKENLTIAEQEEWDRGYKYAGYNVFVSDRIALRRRLKNVRHELCYNITYPNDLPQASVIIPYHKEALSALMRTVFSTIDRAPAHLLKEVILVDDFSEADELLGPLDEFVSLLPKVQVLRNSKREGLMRTRMRGIMAATAPVVVIKDAHTEYFEGWLEPLLAEVAADRTTIAQSLVQPMAIDNFYIFPVTRPSSVHTFDFRLYQQIYRIPLEIAKQRKSPIEPVTSPAMLGTEFALDKQFFLELGGYDPGLEIWGAEEMELSFKTWMCGGSMKVIPCSRVSHLFREAKHRSFPLHIHNIYRVAQVWMDEYKHEVYQRFGNISTGVDIGDLSDRLKLREKLQCKNFSWYMNNIAYMADVPKDIIGQGELHNLGKEERCLSFPSYAFSKHENLIVRTRTCMGRGYEEFWMVTKSGFIRRDARCLSYKQISEELVHDKCQDSNPDQRFNYTAEQTIVHQKSGKCVSLRENVVMEECIQGEQLQQWKIVRRPGAPSV